MGQLSQKEKENALNEVRILASIRYLCSLLLITPYSHPHIIAYKEAFFEESTSSLCMVMEYADGGDLMMRINDHTKNKSHFLESELWGLFVQIVSGLKALHDRKILHRDVKVCWFLDTGASVQTCS
jgi:NIMA (never in mitosis gene a)-related kinase